MNSTNNSPPKSNAPTNSPTSAAPHLPPVTHLASSSTHPPPVPDSVQQQLDHLQLSTNMKIESLATTFAQRFDQLFALLHSNPLSHTLTPHLTMPTPSTIPPHTLPMPTNFRPPPFGIHPRLPPPPPFRHMSETLENPNYRTPQLRLDLPKFDGQDSAGWLYRIEEYFSFYNTPHDERLRLVGLCMEGSASEWFRWMRGNGLLLSWDDFISHVRVRFDPDHFEDYIGALSKLQQTSTVSAYQSDFERLLNKVTGVSEPTLLSVFISGLKPHLRRDLNLRRPATLTLAFAMAREVAALHDESSFTSSDPTRLSLSNQQYSASSQKSLTPAPRSSTTTITTPNSLPLGNPSDRSELPIRRLSYAEKQEKDAQGLCYNCDEKWSRSHRCASRLLLLVGDDDVEYLHLEDKVLLEAGKDDTINHEASSDTSAQTHHQHGRPNRNIKRPNYLKDYI